MAIKAKICGLTTADAVDAAVGGGAAYVGFVFYGPSPRNMEAVRAAELAARVPGDVARVGVFVNPELSLLAETLDRVPLDMIQLHGTETPDEVAAIKARFGCAVIKAVAVRGDRDVMLAQSYADTADYLLFDARPPEGDSHALPGGNGLPFDHRLLQGRKWSLPWFLSGGLTAENLGTAVRETGASLVDVSSGVESAPGQKDVVRIVEFLKTANSIKAVCSDGTKA